MVPTGFENIGVKLELLLTGWSAVALFILAILIIAVPFALDMYEDDLFILFAVMAAVSSLIAAGIWVCMMVPFNGAYQHDYRVKGTVLSVSNTLSDADGDLTRTPVVTLDSVDRPLVVDDPRAVTLKGQDVVLKCSIDWNFRAADSYSCKIISYGTGTD